MWSFETTRREVFVPFNITSLGPLDIISTDRGREERGREGVERGWGRKQDRK